MSSMRKRKLPTGFKDGEVVDGKPETSTSATLQRGIIQTVLVFAVLFAIRWFVPYNHGNMKVFVGVKDEANRMVQNVKCSTDFDNERRIYPKCAPSSCARVVRDNIVTVDEATRLLEIAKKGLALGGSSGGASILDLHSGALSMGDSFINIFRVIKEKKNNLFTEDDFKLYSRIKDRIQRTIAKEFQIQTNQLYLTKPTFFSRMNSQPAKTIHDEYWHPHVDKETYGSFFYTSLLYLATYGTDFTGGRFIFVDKDGNKTVEPKIGRLSFFTSGSENNHYVEKVTSGTRYAITVSFTCNPAEAIADPILR